MVKLKKHLILSPAPALHGLNNTREPKDVRRLGEPASVDMLHNCLTCSRWPSCGDTKRSANYRCTRFREATIEATDLEAIMSQMNVWEPTDVTTTEAEMHALELLSNKSADSEASLVELIDRVLTTNIPIPPDLRLDDRDIPEAKNFLEWATSDKFAGGKQPPFPRQLEIGTKLYSEYCVYCSDTEWFDDMPVDAPVAEIQDRVVFLEHNKCPQCNRTRDAMILKNKLLDPFSLIGVAGQRASKSTSVVLWESYGHHQILKTPNPASMYALLETQPLVCTYTALTFGQATESLWIPLKNNMEQTPWYKNYHNFLDEKGQQLGEELYNLSETFIRYRHRNYFLSAASPSKRTLRGRTRKSAAVDEIGWYPLARKGDKNGNGSDFERLDAKGVRDALMASLFTVKVAYRRRLEEGYNVPKPLFYAVSSPQATNDAIMTFYREAQGSREILSFLYETWNFNPTIKKSDLDEYYRADPVSAARNFECKPPIGDGLFMSDHAVVATAFKKKRNAISVNTYLGLSKSRQKITTSKVKILTNMVPLRETILAVDVGLVNNSFAFSVIGLPENYDDSLEPDDRGTHLTPAQVYAVGEVIPRDGTRISLTHLYTGCLLPMVDAFNVGYFVSDRWQNAKISQDLDESRGVVPWEYQARWEDFTNLRELIETGNLILPALESEPERILETTLDNYPEVFRRTPMDHLYWQFMSVKESTGTTVLKGDGSTDDAFRTIVLGAALLQDEETYQEILHSQSAGLKQNKPALGVVVGMSGGGAGGSSQNTISNNGRVVAGLFRGT